MSLETPVADYTLRLTPLLKDEGLQKQVWHEILGALRRDVPEVMQLVKA